MNNPRRLLGSFDFGLVPRPTSLIAAAIACLLLVTTAGSQTTDQAGADMPAKPQVIFVCVENSNRSQMAEAFARMHGGEKVEAHSAGSKPSGRVNPKAIAAMKERGYDLTKHTSKGLEAFNGKKVAVAVTMGCGDECPLVLADRRVDWEIPDPRDMTPEQFREVRDLIESKVKALLETL